MTVSIYPTEADVGGSGLGRVITEAKWQFLLGRGLDTIPERFEQPFVADGLTYSSATGLTAKFASGRAYINGYVVRSSTNEELTVTLPASSTSYVFLQLQFTSNLVTGAQLISQTSETSVPSDAVLLKRIVTDGAGVTGTSGSPPDRPGMIFYSINGTTIDPIDVWIGRMPQLVITTEKSAAINDLRLSIMMESSYAMVVDWDASAAAGDRVEMTLLTSGNDFRIWGLNDHPLFDPGGPSDLRMWFF